jgi:hypothetical protein
MGVGPQFYSLRSRVAPSSMRRCPMPERRSDEEVSRQILSIFTRNRVQPGGVLQRNNFFDVRDSDFQRGIDRAVANNWIVIDLRNRYRYQLTATGYAARASSPPPVQIDFE